MSGHMFSVMWHVTELDITSTLSEVTHKLLHDHSVSEKILGLRAKALRILGEEFVAAGVPVSKGLGDIKSRFGQQVGGFNWAEDEGKKEEGIEGDGGNSTKERG